MGRFFRGYIREFDMEKSNISLLFEKGFLNEKEYNEIKNMPKKKRQIHIGCMIRDNKEIQTLLDEGMKHYISLFKKKNEINDKDIDEIAKDAIWIKNKIPAVRRFDTKINFRQKQEYDFMYAYKKHIKFYYNSLTGERLVRGITVTDDSQEFVDFIFDILHKVHIKRSVYKDLHKKRIKYYNEKYEENKALHDILTKRIVSEKDIKDNNIKLLNDMIKTFIK